MAKMAKQIKVERSGRSVSLKIDGEEFPWFIAATVTAEVDMDDHPGITLTLLADDVLVFDCLGPATPVDEADSGVGDPLPPGVSADRLS